MTSVFPLAEEKKPVQVYIEPDAAFSEDEEQSNPLGEAKVSATFTVEMVEGRRWLKIMAPLEVHQTDVRWSLVKDAKGNQKKHGLIVACGQITNEMDVIVTRGDGSRAQCKAKKKTLAVNIGFDPTLRTILPAEA